MGRLIVFDMDGTLANTFGLIAASFNFAVTQFWRMPPSEQEAMEINRIDGYNLAMILARHVSSSHVNTAVERYHQFYEQHFKQLARVFPGIREMLTELRSGGVELAVFTCADRRWTETTLRQSDLSDFFSHVITSDDIKNPKPDPEGLMLVMKRTGASKHDTIYVGDEAIDLAASKGAGIRAAGALWGSREPEQLISLHPDFIFKNPQDVLQILDSH